jgi:hypothetical protein
MSSGKTKTDIEAQLKVKVTFYSGLISGAIYKAILHPIDTMKAKVLVSNPVSSLL